MVRSAAVDHHGGMTRSEDGATEQAWAALGGEPGRAGAVRYEPAPGALPARLPVLEMARATVGVCSLAAADLLAERNGVPAPEVMVREASVATAFVSERHLRIDGRAPVAFAPLSGFWRTADGWVRTHANYPHHRSRLLRSLGVTTRSAATDGEAARGAADGVTTEWDARVIAPRLAAVLAERSAHEVQETVYAAGGLAVATAAAPASAVDAGPRAVGLPLVETPRVTDRPAPPLPAASSGPAAGVRVLDLTRVIAGPVATRTLALLGADVLRVDAPGLPESDSAHADTGTGKRSTRLDLASSGGRRVLDELLETADVVVTGYRPGALGRFGLGPESLLDRRPGLIVAQLCAWGWSGPWAPRRGFDSLVQAATGIAAIEAGEDGRPGVLPAQALDHGTGYLLAAGVLRALAERAARGGRHLRFSLAATAGWLLAGVPAAPAGAGEGGSRYRPEPWLAETGSGYGPLTHALPPVGYRGAPRDWAAGPTRWGKDRAEWR